MVEHLTAGPPAPPPRAGPTELAAARTARWSPRRADDHAGGRRGAAAAARPGVRGAPRAADAGGGRAPPRRRFGRPARPVAPPVEPARLAAMTSRTAVLALAREMEITARSLQARLRVLDLARLTAEEQTALDRAKSGLQAVLAGIGEPQTS